MHVLKWTELKWTTCTCMCTTVHVVHVHNEWKSDTPKQITVP